MHTRIPRIILVGLLLSGWGVNPTYAQSLIGRVVDGASGAAIVGARVVVRTSVDAYRTTSLSDGQFEVRLRRSGEHRVEVSHEEYEDLRTLVVVVPEGGTAEVEIRLSRTVLQGDTLIVIGTVQDRFHDATFEAAMMRRERFPNYGFRRVLTHDDPELANSFRISDVLRFMPAGRCMMVWYDGRYVRSREWQRDWLDASPSFVEAVEFYRLGYHAPRAYRTEPGSSSCSILALWSRRTPPETRRPLIRLVGSIAVSALLVTLLR